ncbi:sulfotransferase family protein [Sphingomonas gilva]|nr:sulfotransferase family protein [Sphingomonas gilva]
MRALEEHVPPGIRGALLRTLAPARNPYEPVNDRLRMIFIHVPKTAGSSMTAALGGGRQRNIPLVRYAAYDRKRCADYFKFCFVRNPWDRLLSAYSYLRSRIGLGGSDASWVEANMADLRTFEQFVTAIGRDDAQARQLMSYMHFMPQHRWLTLEPHGEPYIDFVGRFERLDQDLAAVADRLGLSIQLEHRRKSAHRPYREEYDERMRGIVARLYSRDIELFGYDF